MRNKTKTILISISIFIIVFVLLGIPYTNWWFNGDDFHGVFLGFKSQTWKEIFHFFLNGHTNQDVGPSNCLISNKTSFLGTYYRPLYCVYLSIQYWLFKTNAYYYLLTNVFFHAINTVILFNIFLWFINYIPAFLVAMLFAFHPQIGYRFGAIVNLHYYVNVMLLLLCILFFKKYLDSKKIRYNIFACTLFALSLFTRETSIVLPAIIFLGAYLYANKTKKLSSPVRGACPPKPRRRGKPVEPYEHNYKIFFKEFFYYLKITSGLWITALSFLILRLILYPLNFTQTSTQNISIFLTIKNMALAKFPQFQVFMYDLLYLSWLPWGHKILRGIIVISLLSLFTWLFIKNKKKIYVLYFLLCAALMLWPGYIGYYSPRYFYEVAPFLLMAFVFLFKYYQGKLVILKNLVTPTLAVILIFFMLFDLHCFARREQKMHALATATIELAQNSKIQNKSLCFLSHPMDGFGAHPVTISWVLFNDKNRTTQIYCDPCSGIIQADSNIVTPTKWANIISEYFTKNYIEIIQDKNSFRFKSLNPQKTVFYPETPGYSLGKKIINKEENINNTKVVTDFTLNIKDKYLKQDPVFIAWNYERKKFAIIKA